MLKYFLLNLLLTFVWVALTGQLNYSNFLFGYLAGFFILWMLTRHSNLKEKQYFYRVPKALVFTMYFFYDMMEANLRVAKDVITPNYNTTPGIIKYPLDAKTDFEITMLTNIIALTPGTMVMDIADDKSYLYIHTMYLRNKQKFIRNLKDRTETKLLELLR
ncbi:Na+/H+ antiporter subunit E [Myroides pelagicus]|uniref:Na+/H+ antiporter subunit E n=1 Tax=Myroides pelagicus TaxID=270914 RepID=A0A7K1GJ36_9FLAO|nr:Na+/H+ antiporter subunit E [Myroides pelagicus]MEC4114469.1 Na+/H+ antiporter subunit E [Myroides pelagicus]MTH28750.1 Na+/H+ antiporter subunit E [Myroides pelagicus]